MDENKEMESTKKEKKERARSDVWQYFTKLDAVKACCNICDKTYSHSGNTTNLFWHLKRKHQMETCSALSISRENVDTSSQSEGKTTILKKGRSEVWRFFEKGDAKTARCLLCDKILSHSGNTSNLFSHVKHKHREVHENIQTSDISLEEECPSEILPDNNSTMDSHSVVHMENSPQIVLQKKRKTSMDCNIKFVEACSKALENEIKCDGVGYEIIGYNGETKFINRRENGIGYITKVMPKAELNNSPMVIGEYDAVGLNVGAKLKKMEPNQAIFAESLINRILLRGLMETLTSETDLCDKNVFVIENISDGRSQEAVNCYNNSNNDIENEDSTP